MLFRSSRGDLSQADLDRAQHALALDFLKAGLLDRAEDALSKLEGTAFAEQAHLALLSIYERSRDWAKATDIAHKLNASGHGSFQGRLAHYLCEQAESTDTPQDHASKIRLLQQAIDTAPHAARAPLAMAKVLSESGQSQAAYDTLKRLAQSAPTAVPQIGRAHV